ncbi:MAG TPA: hypothetical protein ENK39_09440, partial [Epsilonproteobacteria bacterium]|nr:hypothetical protein [Campylobacterota bacterium]
ISVIAGTVYEDTDGNGVQDAGEPGIPNVTVTITDRFGEEQNLTTDANGNYAANVPAGDTIVDIDETTLPVGVNTQTEGTDTTTVTVPAGGIGSDVDGYEPAANTGRVEGVVYTDTNGDGIQNPGEPGIPGVTVTITDENGNPQVVVTDADGKYGVTVPEGQTVVDVDETTLPGGSTQTGGTDTTTLTVLAGETATDEDGYQPPVNSGNVEGIIYEDTNGNGTQDAGEPGIVGVTVTVTDNTGNTQTLVTDANGAYATVVPAGDANITVDESTLPGGSTQTEGTTLTTVTVPVGGTATDVDGYVPSPESGTVQGVVYEDTNGNGTQDVDEPGIEGVAVTITDSEGRIQTLITDNNGTYSATVPAGDTLVDIEQSDIDGTFTRTEGTDPTIVTVPVGGIGEDVDGFKPAGLTEDNNETGNPGTPVTININENDVDINTSTINLVVPEGAIGTDTDGDGDIDSVVVPGEGTWVVNPTGVVIFTPEEEFTGDPTPIEYTAIDNNDNPIDASTITIDYTQVLRDDSKSGIAGNPVSVAAIVNDDDINSSSINLDETSVGGVGEDTDGDGDIDKVIVDGEGVWTVDENGTVTFTPEDGFVDSPQPIAYNAKDTQNNVVAAATVTINYQPSIAATDDGIITITHYGATDLTDTILGNDAYDGNITITILEQPEHGTVEIIEGADGQPVILYSPDADYNNAPDTFRYAITDVNGQTADAIVNLNIQCGSSQTSDGGDAMGSMSMLMMMCLTLISGLYFVRKEDERGEA